MVSPNAGPIIGGAIEASAVVGTPIIWWVTEREEFLRLNRYPVGYTPKARSWSTVTLRPVAAVPDALISSICQRLGSKRLPRAMLESQSGRQISVMSIMTAPAPSAVKASAVKAMIRLAVGYLDQSLDPLHCHRGVFRTSKRLRESLKPTRSEASRLDVGSTESWTHQGRASQRHCNLCPVGFLT